MGPLEAGYEANRERLGVASRSPNETVRGIAFGLVVSLGGVAMVAVLIYWLGTIFNASH